MLWVLANAGMVAGVLGWLALGVARPRRLALVGGGVAISGDLVRIVVALVAMAVPGAVVHFVLLGWL